MSYSVCLGLVEMVLAAVYTFAEADYFGALEEVAEDNEHYFVGCMVEECPYFWEVNLQ
jgi:hypothetical protein